MKGITAVRKAAAVRTGMSKPKITQDMLDDCCEKLGRDFDQPNFFSIEDGDFSIDFSGDFSGDFTIKFNGLTFTATNEGSRDE